MLLAGDIGGTKTALAIYSPEQGVRAPLVQATYPSAQYASFEALLADFAASHNLAITTVSLGIAGPIVEGRVEGTNLPWVLDRRELMAYFRTDDVRLLNDLEAIASAVPRLEADDLETLNPGIPAPRGTLAVVAPGTGLGEAFLTWDGECYRPYPSEGGHGDFGPTTPLELELTGYLMERYGHVSCERVCSGLGIPNIYAFLRDVRGLEEPGWLANDLARAADPTPVIINQALSETPCELCHTTLETFVGALGAEAGNLGLKVLATGGVYLGGGIPPRIVRALREERFLRAFTGKGRLSNIVERMPLHVILNPQAALLGAAYAGLAPC